MKGTWSAVWEAVEDAARAVPARRLREQALLSRRQGAFKGYVTKFAPQKARKLISWGKLTFDERDVVHRVGGLRGCGTSLSSSTPPRPSTTLSTARCVESRNFEGNVTTFAPHEDVNLIA